MAEVVARASASGVAVEHFPVRFWCPRIARLRPTVRSVLGPITTFSRAVYRSPTPKITDASEREIVSLAGGVAARATTVQQHVGRVPDKQIQGQFRHLRVETTRNIYMQQVEPETWKAMVDLERIVQGKKGTGSKGNRTQRESIGNATLCVSAMAFRLCADWLHSTLF